MKSYDKLYGEVCSLKNLYTAFRKAKKGKSKKWYVKEFEKDLHLNLIKLKNGLENLAYQPKTLKKFIIRDPKTRVISASDFRDRIVHHALCNIIEPIFERTFISDSYANRKKKGTHAALKRFDYFKRKVSHNGNLLPDAKDNNMVFGYALKADIKHYFQSVDHEILIKTIQRKIKDEKILWLIRKILENHKSKISGKGMPIGNLTSQFFANVYLNELDYFVKHRLKAKCYLRYVDDFVILDASKKKLELYKKETNEFLASIKLELHPEKSRIVPLHAGINLLGFRVFYNYKLLKKNNMKRIIKKAELFSNLHRNGVIDKEELLKKLEGWSAYAMHADTYKFRKLLGKKMRF